MKKQNKSKTYGKFAFNSDSTADQCKALKPVFDPSAGKAASYLIVGLLRRNMNSNVDFREN